MDSKQVQEVTTEGVVYLDKDGHQQFIDFRDCLNTYLKWLLGNQTTTQQMIETARASKLVGEIDYLGEAPNTYTPESADDSQPYVLFYDNQLTHFEFFNQNECAEFHQRVMDSGWYLFDSSD